VRQSRLAPPRPPGALAAEMNGADLARWPQPKTVTQRDTTLSVSDLIADSGAGLVQAGLRARWCHDIRFCLDPAPVWA